MKLISVVGARPNFMKIAPFVKAVHLYNKKYPSKNIQHIIVHTGQHYDERMSESFFNDLGIPKPQINLGIGSGTHSEQVGYTMIEFEKVIKREKPDWVIVYGDVNATLACSVTAKKENIRVCHIEAGLRSGDMTMPEEVNRLVTDRLSDILLTPDSLSSDNLRKEGTPEEKITFVGNIMIDTLEANRQKAVELSLEDIIKRNLASGFTLMAEIPEKEKYALMTLHRPSNVDNLKVLEPLVRFLLDEVTRKLTIIWPIHPRTKKQLDIFGLFNEIVHHPNIILLEPVGYLDMLRLNMCAKVMLTDSGGLQEECTILGTPCLTLRWNTERPVTLRENGGASVLVGNNVATIRKEFYTVISKLRNPVSPPLWDGKTAERCLKAILSAS